MNHPTDNGLWHRANGSHPGNCPGCTSDESRWGKALPASNITVPKPAMKIETLAEYSRDGYRVRFAFVSGCEKPKPCFYRVELVRGLEEREWRHSDGTAGRAEAAANFAALVSADLKSV